MVFITGCQADKSSPVAKLVKRPTLHGLDEPGNRGQKIQLVIHQQETADGLTNNEIAPTVDVGDSNASLIPDATTSQTGAEDTDHDGSNSGAPGPVLGLDDLLYSVAECFPEIDVAIAEIEAAEGKILSAYGQFDTRLEASSISQPLSFYKNYRNGIGVAQPLVNGGEVFSRYRIGRGDFEPWYGERSTDLGGEFRAGFSLPLLKDRTIDKRRAAVAIARAGRDQVDANVGARLLQIQRAATQAYWDWVASGRVVQIQQRQLELAQQRVDQINLRVEKGDLAEIARIDNDRFIAARRNSLIKAQRLLQKAAIKLSLFYRDSNCAPVIPDRQQLPLDIPAAEGIAAEQLTSDVAQAIAVRPELVELQAARREACVNLRYAENLYLPKLDVQGFASQDVGEQSNLIGDKSPFELQLGVFAGVPLQRREAQGKINSARAKLVQIDAKYGFLADKIRVELQDAASAVNRAIEQIEQSQANVELTQRSQELGRAMFEAGDIDLIALNIYETAVADAELSLLDAYFEYFFFKAIYETARIANAELPLGW